ncbi:MAG: trypsin-like peptidase domain-containing protein, partial [Acidimicrobiia bacterium]
MVEEPQGGAINSLDEVRSAVIQIQSEGTVVNPDFTVSYNAAGRGSGFIIDPSGLAVTNNHVVTGAGLLKVWIGGDTNKTYNARILGVSECSDLAVIDIDGDGFPYLDWHEGPINVGLDVYAAGFPLGEPEFTLTRGIVSKERAGGETSWASVDYVIEHDATINPGNSGGPLLDGSGKVVGINYRGRDTDQYYAIGRDLAQSLVDTLKTGKDVDTLGINGEAFVGDNFSGIWVYSVESGSSADKAGVQGGDIVTTLEDLVLAPDGTMSNYCDILRTHNPGDTMDIEVLRWASQEVLTGQVNGRELQTSFFFGGGDGGDTGTDGDGSTGNGDGYSYVTVTDDDNSITMEVPAEWSDVDGSNWETTWGNADFIASAISASPDLDAYYDTYSESGVFFAASDRLSQIGGYVQLLDGTKVWYEDDCNYDSRSDYNDGFYEGKFDIWDNCGAENGTVLILSARPIDNPEAFLILVEVKIVQDADLDALDRILATFDVIGS